ncbi:hypothetical protein PIB30_092348, partial [Stylosanthes scabra]|nr:hypothetical protein [Stylosanthes scabra]
KNEERKLGEQKRRKLKHSVRAPTPRHGDSRLGIQNSNPGVDHPRLGVAEQAHPGYSRPTPRRPTQCLGVASNLKLKYRRPEPSLSIQKPRLGAEMKPRRGKPSVKQCRAKPNPESHA